MTLSRARELLQVEYECISRADSCDRQCGSCELVQNTEELLEMYQFVSGILATQESKCSEVVCKMQSADIDSNLHYSPVKCEKNAKNEKIMHDKGVIEVAKRKPCEFCEEEYESEYIEHRNGYCMWMSVFPMNNSIIVTCQCNDDLGEMIEDCIDIPMHYCPNCGRKLT